jgi:tripartite-type tricarboxylate transporter receptor subunit TctC
VILNPAPALAHAAVAAALLLTTTNAAQAQTSGYPTKPIRLIVPYAPAGATDIVARILTPRMIEGLGQQILIDNRPGGATFIGTDLVAKSNPDGYTLLLANIALGANPSLFRKIPYDTAKDFAPISQIAIAPTLLVVHPSVPARTVKDFIAHARGKSVALSYGSAGNGSANHLTTEVFKSMAKIDALHVPYKGAGPAIADLLGGQIAMMFATTLATLPHVKAGKLVALGVSSAQRNPTLPDMPTIAETGLPGFDVNEWNMLVAPAGTPASIIARLHQEVVKSLGSTEARERIAALGATSVGNTPTEAAQHLRNELTRWAKVAKEAGIKPVD